jgi:hypothetical protein
MNQQRNTNTASVEQKLVSSPIHPITHHRIQTLVRMRDRLGTLPTFYERLSALLESTVFCKKPIIHANYSDGRVLWKTIVSDESCENQTKEPNSSQQQPVEQKQPIQKPQAQFKKSPNRAKSKHNTVAAIIKMQLVDVDENQYRDDCKEVFAMEMLEPFVKHQMMAGTVLLYQYHAGMIYKKDFGEMVHRKRKFWPNSGPEQLGIASIQEAAAPMSLHDILKKAADDRQIVPNAFILSCLYQTLANHLSISFYTGLAHNDMYSRNIFFLPVDSKLGLHYHWPNLFDSRPDVSGSRTITATIPSMGALWLIGDWGCVSSAEWDGKEKHNCGEAEYVMDFKKDRSQWGHWHHVWRYSNLGPIRRDWLALITSILMADMHNHPISASVRQWMIYILHELLDSTDNQLMDHYYMAACLQKWFSRDILERYRLESVDQECPSDNLSVMKFHMLQSKIKSDWIKVYRAPLLQHQTTFINDSRQFFHHAYETESLKTLELKGSGSDSKTPDKVTHSRNDHKIVENSLDQKPKPLEQDCKPMDHDIKPAVDNKPAVESAIVPMQL